MGAWFSIEVFDGSTPAATWADAHGDALMESAVTHGASDWSWHRHPWGVVFEVEFVDEEAWETYMALPVVQSALDSVPDPATGLIVYRGRGGSSGAPYPRRPKPLAGSGSAALPLPWLGEDDIISITSLTRPVVQTGAFA